MPWWLAGGSLAFYLKYGGSEHLWRVGVGATIVSMLESPLLAAMLGRYPESGQPWFKAAWLQASFILGLPWVALAVVRIVTWAS